MRLLRSSLIAAVTLNVTLAVAADSTKSQGPPDISPWIIAFGTALMSDYNVRGITVSAHQPSATVYAEPRYRIDPSLTLYGGLSVTRIADPNGATAQLVYYTGMRPVFGAYAFDFGAAYVAYPGGMTFTGVGPPSTCTNGAFFFGQCNTSKGDQDFIEVYGKSSFTVSRGIALGTNAFYAPSWTNSGAPALYASATAKISLPNETPFPELDAFASAELGHYWYGMTDSFYGVPAFPAGIQLPDYTTWNLGVSFKYRAATLDVRYYDTNLSKSNCNVLTGDQTATFGGSAAVSLINPSGLVSNWCSAAFIAKLSFDITLPARQ
jgi:hypothetical protein